MVKIDSHQHFWKFDAIRDSWIEESMSAIQRDFLPEDLEPLLRENRFAGCVSVQSDQSEEENKFHLELAENSEFIKGIVGWVDLQSAAVEDRLSYWKQFEKLKGFRHVLQGEQDRALMLKPEFSKGISKLEKFNFTYDILIFPDQLQYIPQFLSKFPDQKFVIDHLAKPYIKDKKIDGWKQEIERVSKFENVYCKISGLVTENDWKSWREDDFKPYIDTVFNAFGSKRVMFGSDWPVCLVAAKYEQVMNLPEKYISKLSLDEQEAFWGLNAKEFYNLD